MGFTRQQLLQAHLQVVSATKELVECFNAGTATISSVEALVSRGALTDQLPLGDWRETLQKDDIPLLRLLLAGNAGQDQHQHYERLRLALSDGSTAAVRLMLDCEWFAAIRNKDAFFLKDAIGSGCVGKVQALVERGADLGFSIETIPSSRVAMDFVSTPAMFDYLLEKGCQPTTRTMIKTSLTCDNGPRPDLLKSFLAAGTPTDDGAHSAWRDLLNDDARCHLHKDKVINCAQLLLSVGARRRPSSFYSLPALLAALEAGMPPVEADTSLEFLWKAREFPKLYTLAPLGVAEKPDPSDLARLAVPLLERIEALGANIDLLPVLGPCRSASAGLLFDLVGADTGLATEYPDADVATIHAARLRRRAPTAIGPRSSRRI